MPLAADVNGNYLCMHGGLSPKMHSLEDLNKIDRFVEPKINDMLNDILWSDPAEDSVARKTKFKKNFDRHTAFKFGLDPVKKILIEHDFLSLIRAHQVQIDGYKMHRWGGAPAFPPVITLFSAPNYCGSYMNKGAVIVCENQSMNIKQFNYVDGPFKLPNDLDLFSWSIPFITEKVGTMMDHLLKKMDVLSDEDLNAARQSNEAEWKEIKAKLEGEHKFKHSQKLAKIKAKVMAVARHNRMLKNLKQASLEIAQYKKFSSDGKLPRGLLLKELSEIKNDI